jgi:hypothetical protein
MAKHECQNRTGITGEPGEDSQGRTARTGQPGHNSLDMTAKTGKAEQEKQTGQSGQKNSQVGIAMVGLFGEE